MSPRSPLALTLAGIGLCVAVPVLDLGGLFLAALLVGDGSVAQAETAVLLLILLQALLGLAALLLFWWWARATPTVGRALALFALAAVQALTFVAMALFSMLAFNR
jgi:hypothetical protein